MSERRNLQELCLEELDEEFICSICSDVLVNPHQCKGGHIFCLECITTWLTSTKKCPTCRATLRKDDLGHCRVIENLVGKILVKCVHSGISDTKSSSRSRKKLKSSRNGDTCTWQGPLSNLDNHLQNECLFQLIKCPCEGCKEQLYRHQLEDHYSTCQFKAMQCELCHKGNIRREDMGDHLDVCGGVSVSCKNGCNASHLRREMEAHETVCQLAEVKCPFECHGCEIQGLRRCDYNEHQVEFAVKHSELLATAVTQVKKDLSRSGEVGVKWNVDMLDLQVVPDTIKSNIFDVYVAGVGPYECQLVLTQLVIEGTIDLELVINQGPMFPVEVEICFSCEDVSERLTVSSFCEEDSHGFTDFLSLTDEEDNFVIRAEIKIKCNRDIEL